ncbi:MAG: zinc ribbon domain-containing protein, partial [Candidatus Bathyarchaeia archaeon]
KLWPLPLLSPLYDAGLVMGLFTAPTQLYYPPPQTGFQQPSPYGMGACPNCGSPLQPYVNFCDRCGTHVR